MKKVFLVGILALAMGMGMTSCKQNATGSAEGTEAKAELPSDPKEALAVLMEQAKTEGANWTVDQWKDNFKQAMIAAKPMFDELSAVTKEMKAAEGDEAKALLALDKIQKISEKYKGVDSLFTEYGKVAESFPNGKKVSDDREWGKKLMQELGIELDD